MKYIIPILIVLLIPVASAVDFTFSPVYPTTSQSIQFSATVNDSIFPIYYLWDFGDGSHALGGIVYHRYLDDGNYTVTLTIVDNQSIVHQCSNAVMVNNTPPSPSLSWDTRYPKPGHPITFDATGSKDPDGTITEYRWDISGAKKQGQLVVHAFIETGTYTVTLTVTDDDGDSASVSRDIVVSHNRPPSAVYILPSSVVERGANVSFTDASIDPDGSIVSWQWRFGDGHTSTEQNPVHVYHDQGQYTVVLTVTDNDGSSSSYSTEVTVVPGSSRDIPGFTHLGILVAVLVIVTLRRRCIT